LSDCGVDWGGVAQAIAGWLGGVGRWGQRGGSLRGGAGEHPKDAKSREQNGYDSTY